MKKLVILGIATLFISAAFAQQQERIIRFHSDIKIETDGRIEVAEHIKVYAGGDEIKRGIIREIPLTRDDKRGKKARMNYNILAVRRNGENTRYEIKKENGNTVYEKFERMSQRMGKIFLRGLLYPCHPRSFMNNAG